MARMNGRSRFPIDASLILRDAGQAALSAPTTFAYRKLAQTGAVWQNPPDARDGEVYVVGHVEAVTGSPTSVTVDVLVADDAAGTNAVTVNTFKVAAGQWFDFPVDQMGLVQQYAGKNFWAVKVNFAGGTSPTVSAFIYLAPEPMG